MLMRRSPILLIASLVLVVWRLGVLGGAPGAGASYVGSTSQGLPITFSTTSGGVSDITFGWQAVCADGRTHTNSITLGSASLDSGAFATAGVLNTGGQASVSGQVSGANASGQLSRSGPTAFGTNCTDDGVSWTAHRTG